MPEKLTLAEWVGPYAADGAGPAAPALLHGEQREVTDGDLLSGHWKAVNPSDEPPTAAEVQAAEAAAESERQAAKANAAREAQEATERETAAAARATSTPSGKGDA